MVAQEPTQVMISIEEMPQLRIVRLKGEISKKTLPEITRVRDTLVKSPEFSPKNMLVDLKDVNGFDSATIASFVLTVSDLKKAHHRLGFINMPDEMMTLVDIFRVEKNFLLFESEDEALLNLTRPFLS